MFGRERDIPGLVDSDCEHDDGRSDEETDPVQQRLPFRSPPPSQSSASGAHLLPLPVTISLQDSPPLSNSWRVDEQQAFLQQHCPAQQTREHPLHEEQQIRDHPMREEQQSQPEHSYSQPPPLGPTQPVRPGSQAGTQLSQDAPKPSLAELPSLEEVHVAQVPTFTWVPKSVRGDFARVVTELYNNVVNNRQNPAVWTLLYMFPKCIMYATTDKRKKDDMTMTKSVKMRLARWRRGGEEYKKLWSEAVKSTSGSQRRKKAAEVQQTQEERNGTAVTRLAQQGEYTRAVQRLLSTGLAEHNRDNVRQMQAKHPAATEPSSFHPQQSDTPQLSFTADQVMKGILSFRKGSAPGPSGLRAEHLRAATQSAPPNKRAKALEAVTRLVNVMSAGDVPESVAPYLSGARMQAGLKKDGGIRPIAVGNLLRRLTSKCSMAGVVEKAVTKLSPHQLGVGVNGGLEAVIHAVNTVMEEGDEELMILQVDYINAFNLADRDTAFKAVEEEFPEILNWVLTCYGCKSILVFGNTVILSEVGFHQGDPLASLLFSLTLHPIVERISREVPGLKLNEWYLDDGAVAGRRQQLQQVVDILLNHGPARGLHLSTTVTVPPPGKAKSTVWSPHSASSVADPLERGIPSIEEEGIILLGCPIGSHAFVSDAIQERIRKVELATDKLPHLKDAQVEYVLLRSCLSLPKMIYTLRTTDPTYHQTCWRRCDDITREAFCRIIGRGLNDVQWQQAQLPTSMGGMGLISALDHAPAAYATSVVSAQDLKLRILDRAEQDSPPDIKPALLTYLNTKTREVATTDSLTGVTQRAVSLTINLNTSKLLTTKINELGDVREKARLSSVGLPHAGDWLNVLPSPILGLHMRSPEFVVSAKYRLGVPIYPTAGQCPACLQHSDVLGDHAVSCGNQGERIARHNTLRDALYAATQTACLGATREEKDLLP